MLSCEEYYEVYKFENDKGNLLEFSDEKLEELSRKNQALKLEETKKERGEHA